MDRRTLLWVGGAALAGLTLALVLRPSFAVAQTSSCRAILPLLQPAHLTGASLGGLRGNQALCVMQRQLGALGYPVDGDGTWGAGSARALGAFLRAHGHAPEGALVAANHRSVEQGGAIRDTIAWGAGLVDAAYRARTGN